eukprot:6172468-Pleurochrysis_carterae.AAC.1
MISFQCFRYADGTTCTEDPVCRVLASACGISRTLEPRTVADFLPSETCYAERAILLPARYLSRPPSSLRLFVRCLPPCYLTSYLSPPFLP